MRKFFREFKEFAAKGNVLDMAVGVIIGAAFKGIVDSLVGDIISPLLGLFTKQNFNEKVLKIGDVTLGYGAFITAILNFLLISFVLFLVVRTINKARGMLKKKEEEAPATTKICPFCRSKIDIKATRCPQCTSELNEGEDTQET